MKNFDLGYLAEKMSDMSGLPIRIIRNGSITASYSVLTMPADPAVLCLDELISKREHVSYLITPEYHIYGILNTGEEMLVAGPSFKSSPSRQEIHDLAFRLGIGREEFDRFSSFIKAIVPMPLESILQMLCTMNHVFNGEKLAVSDIMGEGTVGTSAPYPEMPVQSSDIYRADSIEKQMTGIVASGDTKRLAEWIRSIPTVRTGILADTLLRQNKNSFIVTTAIVSRTAVKAGMDIEDAYRMSDSFILMCENTKTSEEITSLYISMLTSYTNAVKEIKQLAGDSSLKNDILRYVTHHISEAVTTGALSEHLFISRSRLSTVFKQIYGEDLSRYIQKIKIERSRELLKDKQRTITQISDYLGYSSSSHFTRVFRSVTGMTPNAYRKSLR